MNPGEQLGIGVQRVLIVVARDQPLPTMKLSQLGKGVTSEGDVPQDPHRVPGVYTRIPSMDHIRVMRLDGGILGARERDDLFVTNMEISGNKDSSICHGTI